MNILTVFAHPDDAEIWAGGTIIKHSRRGDQILLCTFAERGSIRESEAFLGAKLLGAEIQIINRSPLREREATVLDIEKIITSWLPNILITHWGQDSHYEHRLVQHIVLQAIISPKILTSCPRMILACDTYNSLGLEGPFSPDIFVDVGEVWSNKVNAIRIHQSQPIHIWEEMASFLGRLHGFRSGCKYAEVFRQIPVLGQYSSLEFLPEFKDGTK